MSVSYQIRQQLVLKFFPVEVSSSWKTAKIKSLFRIHISVAEWIDLLRKISPVAQCDMLMQNSLLHKQKVTGKHRKPNVPWVGEAMPSQK